MFHKAIKLEYKQGTVLELTFRTGEVKSFDLQTMFSVYPPLSALTDRKLFTSGKLTGGYGIIWNDELDLEAETVYEEGTLVRTEPVANYALADALLAARASAGLSQKQLAEKTGLDQSDISKIERGVANPSVTTLQRLAAGLGTELKIEFEFKRAV